MESRRRSAGRSGGNEGNDPEQPGHQGPHEEHERRVHGRPAARSAVGVATQQAGDRRLAAPARAAEDRGDQPEHVSVPPDVRSAPCPDLEITAAQGSGGPCLRHPPPEDCEPEAEEEGEEVERYAERVKHGGSLRLSGRGAGEPGCSTPLLPRDRPARRRPPRARCGHDRRPARARRAG